MKSISDTLRDLTGPDSPVSDDARKAIEDGLSHEDKPLVCPWCKSRYRDGRPSNFASDPRCGFDWKGVFTSDNWQCAGLSILRGAGYEREVWSDDQHCTIVPMSDCRFIVLSYYKHRGRTEGAWVVEGSDVRPLTAGDVYQYQHGLDAEDGLPLGWENVEVVEP